MLRLSNETLASSCAAQRGQQVASGLPLPAHYGCMMDDTRSGSIPRLIWVFFFSQSDLQQCYGSTLLSVAGTLKHSWVFIIQY